MRALQGLILELEVEVTWLMNVHWVSREVPAAKKLKESEDELLNARAKSLRLLNHRAMRCLVPRVIQIDSLIKMSHAEIFQRLVGLDDQNH